MHFMTYEMAGSTAQAVAGEYSLRIRVARCLQMHSPRRCRSLPHLLEHRISLVRLLRKALGSPPRAFC